MILSDVDIKKALNSNHLVMKPPYRDEMIQPVSIDLTLGKKLRVFSNNVYPFIDVKQEQPGLTDLVMIDDVDPFHLHPDAFVLGITEEWLELPNDLMGRLDGKSSLGRLGLLVHSTAGFIDPGFKGGIVLEFSNISRLPITLYAGMPIAQISFYKLTSPVVNPYGSGGRTSKYQNQNEPTPSRYYLNFPDWKKGSSGAKRTREYSGEATALKVWLDSSVYHGDVGLLADDLEMSQKTVEDWVYGRYAPSGANRARLFEITKLPFFHPWQQELISSSE